MASTVVNLNRVLNWTDFHTVTVPEPDEDESGTAALTVAGFRVSGIAFDPVAHTNPIEYKLRDSLVVTVQFNPDPDPANRSWKANWVMSRPVAARNALLTHERGHYKLTGLLARDCKNEMVALRSQTYSDPQDGLDAVNAIIQNFLGSIQPLSDAYDEDGQTNHGQNANQQVHWNSFMSSSLTTGTPILSVLSTAGISV